jgi:hypothetical protein
VLPGGVQPKFATSEERCGALQGREPLGKCSVPGKECVAAFMKRSTMSPGYPATLEIR